MHTLDYLEGMPACLVPCLKKECAMLCTLTVPLTAVGAKELLRPSIVALLLWMVIARVFSVVIGGCDGCDG